MQAKAILILDQEEVVRDSLQLILSDEGYRCFLSTDESETLGILAKEEVDVIILDSQLAVQTDLLKTINAKYPHIKSIVISSYMALEMCRVALMRQADEFILKPIDFDELIILLNGFNTASAQ